MQTDTETNLQTDRPAESDEEREGGGDDLGPSREKQWSTGERERERERE